MSRRRSTALIAMWCLSAVIAACGEASDEEQGGTGATTAATAAPESTVTDSTERSTSGPPATPTATITPQETTMAPTDVPSTPQPPATPTSLPNASNPSSSLEHAVSDLEDRVGAGVEIELVSQDEVTWTDGSLGCPQPGMYYTQALVDGERIVLRANGVDYEYHSAKNQPPFYCPPERLTPPSSGGARDI